MEKEVFLQGLHCSSLTGVETAAWSGCTRVEISGTALNCLLLVTGFHQPGFKMFAASLKPPSAISLPGTRLAPIMGTLSFSLWMQLGSHPIQAPHREFEKGKQSKTGEIQQLIWWSFHPSWELSPISHDNEDAAGRASLSWGVGLSLYSPKGHVLEGRSVDLETGVWCSCCDELNLPDCSALT